MFFVFISSSSRIDPITLLVSNSLLDGSGGLTYRAIFLGQLTAPRHEAVLLSYPLSARLRSLEVVTKNTLDNKCEPLLVKLPEFVYLCSHPTGTHSVTDLTIAITNANDLGKHIYILQALKTQSQFTCLRFFDECILDSSTYLFTDNFVGNS